MLEALVGEMSREEIKSALGLRDRKSFRQRYLAPALAAYLNEMTHPGKFKSRLQKYLLTGKGRKWVHTMDKGCEWGWLVRDKTYTVSFIAPAIKGLSVNNIVLKESMNSYITLCRQYINKEDIWQKQNHGKCLRPSGKKLSH